MKEIFYFLRDKDRKPVVSVCLLLDETSSVVKARGVAICSDMETPCANIKAQQRNGPGLARRRAYKVLVCKQAQFKVIRKEARSVLTKVVGPERRYVSFHEFKGFYLPLLSDKEKRIVAAVWPERGKQDSTLSKTVSEMEAA